MNTLAYLMGDTGGAFNLLGCICVDLIFAAILVIAIYFCVFQHEDDALPFDDEDEE